MDLEKRVADLEEFTKNLSTAIAFEKLSLNIRVDVLEAYVCHRLSEGTDKEEATKHLLKEKVEKMLQEVLGRFEDIHPETAMNLAQFRARKAGDQWRDIP
mgnify:CR=1 FL=1|jgi:hypothetical protein